MAELVPALQQRWRRYSLYLLVAAVAALALFWATAPWPDTPDGLFHLHRVRSLAEALQAGVLYPRWFPDFAFGYGYPTLNYYAPAFYYGPALLHLASLDVITATRLALALWYAVSALAMIALLRCWTRPAVAVIGALLFLAFPYRLYDLFVRGALPEFAAFTWLPLITFFNYRMVAATIRGASPRTTVRWFVLTTLAWSGLILTHNLTALMAILAAGAMIVLLTPIQSHAIQQPMRPIAPRIWLHALLSRTQQIGFPLLAGLALSAFQLAPALFESSWVMLGAAPVDESYQRHFADWGTLLTTALFYPYPDAAAPTVMLPAYLAAILAAAFVALLAWRTMPLRTHLYAASAMSALFIVLMTAASAPIWSLTASIMSKLQFPWRWQTLLSVSFVCMAATLLEATQHHAVRHRSQPRTAVIMLAGGLLTIYALIYAVVALERTPATFADHTATNQTLSTEQMWAFDAQHGQVGATWIAEFLPRWVTEERWAIGRGPAITTENEHIASIPFAAIPLQQGYLDGVWRVQADVPLTLRFHRFFFPAWQVTIDGVIAPAYADGVLGRLAVDLDAGEHLVEVRFAATPALWLGLVVSSATLFGLAWAIGKAEWNEVGVGRTNPTTLNQANTAKSASSAWVVPASVAVAAMAALLILNLNLTAQSSQPQAIGADYGAVRLEAATVGAATIGETAPVRLDWSLQAPQEWLTTFVHVVDMSGQVVAQKDEPLAGRFTPFERWQPGLSLSFTHHVPLPANLAPGRYTIYAGLYPAGQPDTPLHPRNYPDVRIEIGSMEVTQ